MKKRAILILFFILLVLISACSTLLSDGHRDTPEHRQEHQERVHLHADFKVFINDQPIDFSVKMYQLRARSVHVEDGIGETIHVHKKGITIGNFFESLGFEFNNTCITIPIEGSYCNINNKKLSFYVNGLENNEFENYEIKDQDKILVSYGIGNIKKQLKTI